MPLPISKSTFAEKTQGLILPATVLLAISVHAFIEALALGLEVSGPVALFSANILVLHRCTKTITLLAELFPIILSPYSPLQRILIRITSDLCLLFSSVFQ